jgi:hypothetical protein
LSWGDQPRASCSIYLLPAKSSPLRPLIAPRDAPPSVVTDLAARGHVLSWRFLGDHHHHQGLSQRTGTDRLHAICHSTSLRMDHSGKRVQEEDITAARNLGPVVLSSWLFLMMVVKLKIRHCVYQCPNSYPTSDKFRNHSSSTAQFIPPTSQGSIPVTLPLP